MVDVIVPNLGESIADASVAKILKKVGDHVDVDEVLFELETDKATMEVNSPCGGTIKSLSAKEGDEVQIGAVIAQIEQSTGGTRSTETQSLDSKKEQESNLNSAQQNKALQNKSPSNNNVADVALGNFVYGKQHSPAARHLMAERGINGANIDPTGKDGRITKSDVLQYKSAADVANTDDANLNSSTPSDQQPEKAVPMTKLRQKIAQRLKESQNTAAILTTFNEVDMQNVMNIRSKYKEAFEKKHGIKLGFMSFFTKAAIAALKEFPEINAEIRKKEIIYKNFCNIGVAVGTPNGLVVPVVKNAQDLSMAQIEKQIAAFGKKAKEGKLRPEDMQGGTFTISNGGIYGSLMSTPIINPPQSGILGLHSIKERPVVVNKEIKIRPMMYLALSYDHRIVDGKEAVTFLVRIKSYIENPERLVLDV